LRYEALWLSVALGLLLEAGLVFAVTWTLLLPLTCLAMLGATFATRDRALRRSLGRASEVVSAGVAVAYLLLMLLSGFYAIEPAGQAWLGREVSGTAAYARLGLTVLALLGAVFFYSAAHALEDAQALPVVVGNPRYRHTVAGYRVLLSNMIGLFLIMAGLAITFAMALQATLLLAYLEGTFDPVVIDFTTNTVIRWGGVVAGFLLSGVGLAGTAQAMRGAKEVGGDQVPILSVAAMLWGMSLLVHTLTSLVPTVSGGFVAVLALSGVARTLSTFYPTRVRVRIWLTTLFIAGIQFPASAVSNLGPSLCPAVLTSSTGLLACETLIGDAGSLVAVMGSALFGYLFAGYYVQVLKALRATREAPVLARPVAGVARAPPSPLRPAAKAPRVGTTDEMLIPPPP